MPKASHPFTALLQKRVVVLDGAMGTTLQRLGLSEADYRGERFRDWKGKDLKGAIELLLLTKPEAVERVHEESLRAGADVIETNTFSATTIGLQEFLFDGKPNNGRKDPEFFECVVNDVGLRETVREINNTAARMACEAGDRVSDETGEPRFVAGALGPLPVTASLSPDVNDPGFRAVTFDQIKQSYRDQIDALLEGGVDVLLVETIFDTLNAKAAFAAAAKQLPPRALPTGSADSDPGSARASRAVSGASPETSSETTYPKRGLPHFDRPWGKYALAFSTRDRRELSPAERDIVLRSALRGHEHQQYELYVACVMPDHVHLLFEPQIKEASDGKTVFWTLSEILDGIKSSTAHRINTARPETGAVWEQESFDWLIRSETDLQEKFLYICRNPWDSNFVVPNEDYPWLWTQERSSAGAPKRARDARALPREEAQAEVEETSEDADRPHEAQQIQPLHLSGLEPLNITRDFGFAVIGERTNITGSPKFSKLILAGDFEGAVTIARQQIANGANIIDVNVDEGMLDSEATMTRFLNLVSSEPEIARVPFMIDSSKWSVIEAGLKCAQGKSVVNSISLKNGEEEFLRQAQLVRRYGAAVIVMAFDERGQADK